MNARPLRLAGPRVALLPVPVDVATSAVAGTAVDLSALGLVAAPGWPQADTADALRPIAEHGQPGDTGTWLIAYDGQVIGDCGWFGPPDEDGVAEIGYGLAAPSRGRGLGTEAVGVLACWVERQAGVRLVAAEVLVGNEPSLRLLARLGFVEHGSRAPYLRLVRPAPGAPRPTGRHVC